MYAYADDIALLCKNVRQTKNAIKLIDKWGKSNGMHLNKKKCGILFYNTHRRNLDMWEKEWKFIENIPIIDRYEYLGITLDKKLSCEDHLEKIGAKIEKFIKLMRLL